jgi:hypothetical protein
MEVTIDDQILGLRHDGVNRSEMMRGLLGEGGSWSEGAVQ